MNLTDAEKQEFLALTKDSYDPDLWDESDLPCLRAARAEHEREQERERGGVSPVEQPNLTDGEGSDPDPRSGDDG
jgi:hypothetical protein